MQSSQPAGWYWQPGQPPQPLGGAQSEGAPAPEGAGAHVPGPAPGEAAGPGEGAAPGEAAAAGEAIGPGAAAAAGAAAPAEVTAAGALVPGVGPMVPAYQPHGAREFTVRPLKGISARTQQEHFGLYRGYVENTNEARRGLAARRPLAQADPNLSVERSLREGETWNWSGVKNHEMFFSKRCFLTAGLT